MQPSASLAAKRPTGMTAFIIVWLGQIVSVLASSMSQFGLTIGGFIAAAILAGLRYVRAHGNVWSGRERHHLALAYAITSFLVSALVMGAVTVAIFFIEGEINELFIPLSEPSFFVFLGISLAVGLVSYYALARFGLFVVDRAAHAGAGQSS